MNHSRSILLLAAIIRLDDLVHAEMSAYMLHGGNGQVWNQLGWLGPTQPTHLVRSGHWTLTRRNVPQSVFSFNQENFEGMPDTPGEPLDLLKGTQWRKISLSLRQMEPIERSLTHLVWSGRHQTFMRGHSVELNNHPFSYNQAIWRSMIFIVGTWEGHKTSRCEYIYSFRVRQERGAEDT